MFFPCYPTSMPRRHDPDTPIRGAILLGQVAEPLPKLEVVSSCCDRRGRLGTARLTAEHGPQMPLSEAPTPPIGGRPKRIAGQCHDACGAPFPEVAEASNGGRTTGP